MPGLAFPAKGREKGSQLVFAALLADFIGVCKGTEVVMPEIWWQWWVPAAQHPEQALVCARDARAGPSPLAAWPCTVPTSVPPPPGKGHTTLCGTPGAAELASPAGTRAESADKHGQFKNSRFFRTRRERFPCQRSRDCRKGLQKIMQVAK